MGPVKDADIIKSVKDNNRTKLLKYLSQDKAGSFKKIGVKEDKSVPGGRIRLQLTHVNVNCHDENTGYTPLIIAILNGNQDMTEDLIFHSADVNSQDNKGNTALHMAVFGGQIELIDILLQNRAKVMVENSDGNTPLHIACQTNFPNKVHIMLKLLAAGADINIQNKDKKTALDIAAMFNKSDAVSVLLDHEYNLDASNQKCHKVNMQAIIEASIRGYKDIVEMLLDYGYDPNTFDKEKDTTPLIEAVRFMRFPVAESLLKYGAKSDITNSRLESPQSLTASYVLQSAKEKFIQMFADFKTSGPTSVPRFLKLLSRGMSLKGIKDDLCSCWIAAEVHQAWTILDLKHEHTLTGITIYGWDSPQMVRAFELQKGGTVNGPWSTVMSGVCVRSGSSVVSQPGQPQTFTAFKARSRFWRLLLLDNHGGNCICFHGIHLHGVEEQVWTLLKEINMDHYADDIINQGFNIYRKLLLVSENALQNVVCNDDDRSTILKLLNRERVKEFHPTSLSWNVTPVVSAKIGEIIPDFSVKSSPGVKTKISLNVDADVAVIGNTVVMLQSDSLTEPSIATFSGIIINAVGHHKLTVQCVDYPKVFIETPQLIEIKPKVVLDQSVAKAFDDMEAMLKCLSDSLDA